MRFAHLAAIATTLILGTASAVAAQDQIFGSWRLGTENGAPLLSARQTADSDDATTLSIRCDQNAGLELWLTSNHSIDTAPRTEASILVDGRPAGALEAHAALPGLDLAFLKLSHAEAIGQKLAHARRIGIRLTDAYSNTKTYYFGFRDLVDGSTELQRMCPA